MWKVKQYFHYTLPEMKSEGVSKLSQVGQKSIL